MKVTKAESRLEGRNRRLYVTIDGIEWLIPCAKDIMLAQGLTLAPEDWPYPLAERYIFFDLTDEDSPSAEVEGITEPVLVGLAIRASRKDWLGPVPIPCEAEAVAAIRWMCKQQRKKGALFDG